MNHHIEDCTDLEPCEACLLRKIVERQVAALAKLWEENERLTKERQWSQEHHADICPFVQERDEQKARADEAEQDARQMYAVFKNLREIVKNAERHIGIEQIVAVFAPLRWEGDKPPKWLDPLVKAEAKLREVTEELEQFKSSLGVPPLVPNRTLDSEANISELREALRSECPCTCRPHALGKDKPLTCSRRRVLASTAAALKELEGPKPCQEK